MDKTACLNELKALKHLLKNYKSLLVSSKSDSMSKIVKNQDQISNCRHELVDLYNQQQSNITQYGTKPVVRVGPTHEKKCAYELALKDTDVILDTIPAIDEILLDLSKAHLKLEQTSDEEFDFHANPGINTENLSPAKKMLYKFKAMFNIAFHNKKEACLVILIILVILFFSMQIQVDLV
jgi:hypothetical protein